MVGDPSVASGYSNQTHLNDGTSVVIFHQTGLDGYWSCISIDDYAGAGAYNRVWDLPDNIVGATSGDAGAWPKVSVLYCLDETVYPDSLDYIHIVETEASTCCIHQEHAYLRCFIDPADSNNLICQSPNEPPYTIPANTPFQD